MPPPQQLLSPAVSIISKWLNPTFLVLLVFLIVALPLSTPSASTTQQSPSQTHHNQSFSSPHYSFANTRKQWPHWSAQLGEICPSAEIWATHPGGFCVTLWNSPYLSNRTELEAREGRAIKHFCEMDRILERFDCAQEYSVNVLRGQCKLCRDAYREWACAMVTDTLDDGQLDCETKLMPCPSCASICHQVMRLCPYLTPDRNQAGPDGRVSPQVSQYGGHPAFYCPLENDDPSDPAYTSLCFHQSPFSADPDSVNNICTNPPIHHHHNPYEETQHYFSHRSKANNDRRSYFSQSSTDKRFSGRSSSSRSPTGSPPGSNKGRRGDYLDSSEKTSSNNNNNYFDSDSNTNTNSANYFNKFEDASFIPDDDHEDGDDEDNWSEPIPHYTSCCWTYASSVVTFTAKKAYPEYGSDSYFSSVEPTTSSSSITVLTNSGSGSSSTSATTDVNRKPSSVSDNRVILNCCDSRGECTSREPFEVDNDDYDSSSSSESGGAGPPPPPASSDSQVQPAPLSSHPKLKTSRKRSSENIGNTPHIHSHPNDESLVDKPDSPPGSLRDNLQELHPVRERFKAVPQEILVPESPVDHDHGQQSSRSGGVHQLEESLPKPTHIPPGLDYDEHYMDTEPDGDGGSSSTELEDEDAFEPSFRADWEKAETHRGSRHPDYSPTWSRDTTFSSHHKKREEVHRRGRNQESNSNNLMKLSTTTSTTINNLRNNYKHDNNKNNNLKEGSSISSSVMSGGESSSKSSSSVHYQKNAFMAIVIGGDDVDRRHLNLRTATDIVRGGGENGGGGGGGGGGGRAVGRESEINGFQVQGFQTKFSSDIHFNSLDFSNDYENDPSTDEIYFRRMRGDLDSDTEAHPHNQKLSQLPGHPLVQTMTTSASSARSPSSSILGMAYSTLKRLKGSLFLIFFSPSLELPFSIESLQSSRTLEAPQYYSGQSRKTSSRTRACQYDSADICYYLFTFFLLLLLLTTTNNFLPIPLLTTDVDDYLPPSAEVLETRTTNSSQTFMRTSVTLNIGSWSSTPNKSKSVMTSGGESGLRKGNEKDKRVDRAAAEAVGVMNAEDNQDYKNYYDDIRSNNLGASANYTNYNCTDSRKLCKCKYDLYEAHLGFNREGIYDGGTPTSREEGRKLFKKIVQTKQVDLPRLGTLFRCWRDDNKGDSCSHQLALLYYKVIKFLLILRSRSSDDDTITILSVQHKNNSIVILGYFLKLVTITITCIVADLLALTSWSPWRGRTRGRRRVRIYSIKFKNERLGITISSRTITRLEYYYEDLEEDFNDNTGIKLCCSRYYNYMVVVLSTIVEANFEARSSTRTSVLGVVGIPSGEGVLRNSGHSGDNDSRCKMLKYNSTPPTDSLELIRLRTPNRLSDSWVTTNCTTSSSTIASFDLCSKRRYEYSNRINSRVTIINKIIQFVVQYNLDGSFSGSGGSSRGWRKKSLGQFKIFKMYSNCSRERSEKGELEADEFPTKSYSKFLAFWLINTKISLMYDSNQDDEYYYWYNESIRWLQEKPPSPCNLQVKPLFLMCYSAGSQKCQAFINCQQCHQRQNFRNSEILTISQGCSCIQLLDKLLPKSVAQAFVRSKLLLRDYDKHVIPSHGLLCNYTTEMNYYYYYYYHYYCHNYYYYYYYYYCYNYHARSSVQEVKVAALEGHCHGQSICFPYSLLNVNCSILPNCLTRIDNNYENIIVKARVCTHCKRRWSWGSLWSGSGSFSSRCPCEQCPCSSWTAKDSNATFIVSRALRAEESVQCFLLLLHSPPHSYLSIFNVLNILNILNIHFNLLSLTLLEGRMEERRKLQKIRMST